MEIDLERQAEADVFALTTSFAQLVQEKNDEASEVFLDKVRESWCNIDDDPERYMYVVKTFCEMIAGFMAELGCADDEMLAFLMAQEQAYRKTHDGLS